MAEPTTTADFIQQAKRILAEDAKLTVGIHAALDAALTLVNRFGTRDAVLYAITREDVDTICRDKFHRAATDDDYHYARKSIEALVGDGVYTWADAIEDALQERS